MKKRSLYFKIMDYIHQLLPELTDMLLIPVAINKSWYLWRWHCEKRVNTNDGRAKWLELNELIRESINPPHRFASENVLLIFCIWHLSKHGFFSFWQVYFLHMWPPERKLKIVGRWTYHQRKDPCCLMNLLTQILHLVGIWKMSLWTFVLTHKQFFKTLSHIGWILTFIKLGRWSIQSMGDNMLLLSMPTSSYMPCHHVLGYSFVITELLWHQWQL